MKSIVLNTEQGKSFEYGLSEKSILSPWDENYNQEIGALGKAYKQGYDFQFRLLLI